MSQFPHNLSHPAAVPERKFHAKSFRSMRPLVALALVAVLALANFHKRTASAQSETSNDADRALAVKADKLIKQVYHTAAKKSALPIDPSLPVDEAQQEERRRKIDRLSRVVDLEREADGDVKVSLTVRLTNSSVGELRRAGFAVGARIGNIATVETQVERLPALASLPSVGKMEAAVFRHPLNDRARQSIGVDNGAGQRAVSQTGRGVVVGVIDTGIDFRHGDFIVPGSSPPRTRIKALWDISDRRDDYVLPGGSVRRGHAYTEADINAALANPSNPDLVRQKDLNGHGTHVAGSAAGNGYGGTAPATYAGMAPEADLVVVKATRSTTADGGFSTSDTINALKFIEQQAQALGEPFVINMSLGGHLGPHDGTAPDERAIDNLVSGGAGRVVCVAAGNEGSDGIHARTTVAAGGAATLELTAASSPEFLDLYYAASDRFTVTVTRPDGVTLGPVAYDPNGFSRPNGQAEDQYVRVYNALDTKGDTDPQNDQPDIYVTFRAGAESLGPNWRFTIQDADGAGNSAFDAWVGDGRFTTFVDDNSRLVSSPGTSRGAITVGAYVTRSASQTVGAHAPFTSPGPTADGRQKPDIGAPGYYLYSSKSRDNTRADYYVYGSGPNAAVDSVNYGGLAGTSMATPVAAGAAALLLQANRNLTSDQIKTFITSTANRDSFTGAGWNARFGFGKLNIASALGAAGGAPVAPDNPIDTTSFFVSQQYTDFLDREPEPEGFAYWTSILNGCGSDRECLNRVRIEISSRFFAELEFQQTGYYVMRLWRSSYGRFPNFTEFIGDRRQVQNTEESRGAFARQWVQRPAFIVQYGNLTDEQFVNRLYDTAELRPFTAERASHTAALRQGQRTRAEVLREVIELPPFGQRQPVYNAAWVRMQYFGYLRRDVEPAGEAYWIDVINVRSPNNYLSMICAFVSSSEYQLRFAPVRGSFTERDCAW